MKQYLKKCENCGKYFITLTGKKQLCSVKCVENFYKRFNPNGKPETPEKFNNMEMR